MAIGLTNASVSAIKTMLTVIVTDSSASGYQSGRTVTITNGVNTMTGTTDSSGSVTFKLTSIGDYTVTSDVPSGATANTATVSVSLGGSYVASITLKFPWTFSMNFNSSTFASDPTGCLTYADGCAGFTPVSGPGSSLAKCSTIGSWVMNADGTSSNAMLRDCFYCTFTSDGEPHEKLNPQNLAQKIATWNGSGWVSASGSSSITTENTFFCIPTTYQSGSSSKVSLSSSTSAGTPYAHTIDSHVYQYLGIGVYGGYDDGSRLWSLSGKASSASITRPNFRTHAQANPVKNGKAMLWNFYQWRLWWLMTIFAMKSFNGQTRIGQGGFTYNGGTGQGLCNAMGPFAGSTSTSASTSTSVKAFIENPWGYKYEFIDDFVVNDTSSSNHEIWVGQHALADDTYTTSTKTKIITSTLAGGSWLYAKGISTSAATWGFITTSGGSTTTGLCDGIYFSSSTEQHLGGVGGSSADVSDGIAGPSYLRANYGLSVSGGNLGARLAFVFDL